MSLADVFNPTFDTEMPLFSNLLIELDAGCVHHRRRASARVDALLHTFETIHIGAGEISTRLASCSSQ